MWWNVFYFYLSRLEKTLQNESCRKFWIFFYIFEYPPIIYITDASVRDSESNLKPQNTAPFLYSRWFAITLRYIFNSFLCLLFGPSGMWNYFILGKEDRKWEISDSALNVCENKILHIRIRIKDYFSLGDCAWIYEYMRTQASKMLNCLYVLWKSS